MQADCIGIVRRGFSSGWQASRFSRRGQGGRLLREGGQVYAGGIARGPSPGDEVRGGLDAYLKALPERLPPLPFSRRGRSFRGSAREGVPLLGEPDRAPEEH